MYVAQAGNFEAVRYLLEVQSVRVNDQDRVSLSMHYYQSFSHIVQLIGRIYSLDVGCRKRSH